MSEPLKPAVFHILLALAGGERHGYGVMQAVREQSAGAIPLRTGSFYRHLDVLLDARLVEEAPARARPGADPRRGAYYRLTREGRSALARERARLVALVGRIDAAETRRSRA